MNRLAAWWRGVPSWQVTLGVALLALGFLIAVQLSTQGARVRYASSERPPLLDTANELLVTQDQLKARIVALRAQIGEAERGATGNSELVQRLDAQLNDARLAVGLVELQGPGLVIKLDDSTRPVPPGDAAADYLVSASDVRDLLGEMWLAGAEAVSINGERVVVTTALTDIGSSVLVNASYLQPPYVLSAIGPADMHDRLTKLQGFIDFVAVRVDGYGLQLSFLTAPDVVVSAYSGTINLVQARPATAQPTATP
ncbi:MAG: DUF881 domain-containing protein [Candidatus Limnocylindrales bacterium]